MAEVGNKKRKRLTDGDATTKKKVVIDGPPPTASVCSLLRPKFCPPVIATVPGIEMPADLVFRSYVAKDSRARTKQPKSAIDQALLLHSTTHRSLDYTAKEEEAKGSKPFLNHYIGVYDPATGRLQVVEAKKMTVRGAVRSKQVPSSSGERDTTKTQSILEQRTDLGQTFGTKKAKKVIQDKVLNALTPQIKAGDAPPTKMDDASKAMLASVGKLTSDMASREQLQAVIDEAKPVPRANLDASEIYDVYNPNDIIGAEVLKLVPVMEWQEKARHKEGIQTHSQFVASRVNALATNDTATERLRILGYLNCVLGFFLRTAPGRERGTRRLPPREKLRELMAPAPDAVIENIKRKFSEGGAMRKFHIDLLMAYCCVLACIIDNFEVDTEHLRCDLRIDQRLMNQYFHEIGARVKPVKNVATGRIAHVAKLVIPLDFPKQRQIRARR